MSRRIGQRRATRSDAALLFAALGGLTAWLVDVFASWALVPVACNAGASWVLHLVAAAAGLAAAVALAMSISAARDLAGDAEASRHRFVAGVGIGLNGLALIVIAFMWLLVLFLEPCQGNQEFPLWLF